MVRLRAHRRLQSPVAEAPRSFANRTMRGRTALRGRCRRRVLTSSLRAPLHGGEDERRRWNLRLARAADHRHRSREVVLPGDRRLEDGEDSDRGVRDLDGRRRPGRRPDEAPGGSSTEGRAPALDGLRRGRRRRRLGAKGDEAGRQDPLSRHRHPRPRPLRGPRGSTGRGLRDLPDQRVR
ncbi:hypothetical protein AKJ08_3557 [Vulgatibacter incomptus]|uniref:Uncharacterized protein n=1 Tax=Vulgatibacter incomptus TaxID=1391653 RepID=A0A0K1PI16_9BACT|nr:hypothetical protein AKJ08_3557 [Vulgatibacter incomptus]